MEAGTGLTILGSAIGSAKLVEKLLGPTADYIGGGVKTWTEKRVNNVSRIFQIAAKKLGSKIDKKGSVPPKILKGILEDGSFCDDELAAEYFGGVLASSRSGIPRDDRGASYIALLARLSTYQIRAHYCFYHILKKIFKNNPLELTIKQQYDSAEVMVPLSVYKTFMDFSDDEKSEILLTHIMTGLLKEFLVETTTTHGIFAKETSHIYNLVYDELLGLNVNTKGKKALPIAATVPGIELFLWAYGKPDLNYKEFFYSSVQFPLDKGVVIPKGAYRMRVGREN